MPTVSVYRSNPIDLSSQVDIGTPYVGGTRMTIAQDGGDVVIQVPYAPKEVQYSDNGPTYDEVQRPGRNPIVVKASKPSPKMQFTLMLGSSDWETPIDNVLNTLRGFLNSEARVRVNYSSWEAGLWWVNSMNVTSSQRHPITNEITRADVEVSFILASTDAASGPVAGGATTSATTNRRPAYYVVAKGDTLSKIALRFYGDASAWKKIAKANNLVGPKKFHVGLKLRLP